MPFVVLDAQNKIKTSKVLYALLLYQHGLLGRKTFPKQWPKMALKWLKIAFSVLNLLSNLPSKIYCALTVTNQSTEM